MGLKRNVTCADNNEHAMDDELAKVREWAQDQLDAGEQPPWATHRYLQVVALIDQMLASRHPPPDPIPAGSVVYLDFARRRRA
jgi:hypothetical protein